MVAVNSETSHQFTNSYWGPPLYVTHECSRSYRNVMLHQVLSVSILLHSSFRLTVLNSVTAWNTGSSCVCIVDAIWNLQSLFDFMFWSKYNPLSFPFSACYSLLTQNVFGVNYNKYKTLLLAVVVFEVQFLDNIYYFLITVNVK
jgi:hypothetical protein